MNIIVTYFEPFGKRLENASGIVAGELPYPKFMLRVGFREIHEDLESVFKMQPDALIMLGEAGSYHDVTVELMAHNIANGLDNYGIQKNDEAITDGPAYLETCFHFENEDFTCSMSAGKYLCNYSYYLALKNNQKALFIHVPYLETMPKDEIITKINQIIAYLKEQI